MPRPMSARTSASGSGGRPSDAKARSSASAISPAVSASVPSRSKRTARMRGMPGAPESGAPELADVLHHPERDGREEKQQQGAQGVAGEERKHAAVALADRHVPR